VLNNARNDDLCRRQQVLLFNCTGAMRTEEMTLATMGEKVRRRQRPTGRNLYVKRAKNWDLIDNKLQRKC